jgi:hypothetical protein
MLDIALQLPSRHFAAKALRLQDFLTCLGRVAKLKSTYC